MIIDGMLIDGTGNNYLKKRSNSQFRPKKLMSINLIDLICYGFFKRFFFNDYQLSNHYLILYHKFVSHNLLRIKGLNYTNSIDLILIT